MIFVTGGTGLVGAHLLYEITKAGKPVKALKRKKSNVQQVLKTFSYYSENPEVLFDTIEWVEGDILDYFSLEKLLKGVSEIYHCAAIVSFEPKKRREMISSNVGGTANIVNAAIENGVKRICHVSSIAALGRLQNGHFVTEETNWIPSRKVTGYSESKFFSELEIWRGIEEGLDAVIVNPSIIIGPANWENGSAKMFKSIRDGLKFYTKGITGFIDVKDVSSAMVRLMDLSNFADCKNQRFILSAENLSYQSVFFQIADSLEKPRPKYYSSDFLLKLVWRVLSVWTWVTGNPLLVGRDAILNANSLNNFDGSKITRVLNFKYQSINKSIEQTAGFFKTDISKSY